MKMIYRRFCGQKGRVFMKVFLFKCLKALTSGLLAMAFLATGLGLDASMLRVTAANTAAPVVYEVQDCYSLSSVASMTVNGVNVPILAFTKEYDHAQFSFPFPETATITLTFNETVSSYSVSPLAKGIPASASGNTLTFSITESTYMIVKVNSIKEIIIAADNIETDVPAATGEGIYNIVSDYGADPTGAVLSTDLIQKAIDDATAVGGGIVYIPSGLYYFDKGIQLKSNVHLYLEGGAVVRSVASPENFEYRCHKDSLNMDVTWLFYTEEGATNVKLYGRGTIDANGTSMRQDYQYLATIVMPLGCSYFTLDGLTFRDGGFWSTVPTRSDHVTIVNTKHLNDNNVLYENDAIDICESQYVEIKHTLAISEDDTYSTKTWSTYPITDIAIQWYGSPEENNEIVFDDCFGWSHCATFKVGDGNFQPQRNITFQNSYSYKSSSALKFTHGYGTEPAENVTFENIDIEGYAGRLGGFGKWIDFYLNSDGMIRNVVLRNINIRTKNIFLNGTLKGRSANYYYDGVTLDSIYYASSTPATTLAGMGITDVNSYVKNLTILPISEEVGPDPGNLALNKDVYASSVADNCPAMEAVDGYDSTRWASERTDDQWIYVDLGKPTVFDTIVLIWEAAYGKTYTLDISDDAQTWTTIYTESDGTGGTQTISFEPLTARYVRMKGLTRGTTYGYSLYEFKIYSRAQVDPPAAPSILVTNAFEDVNIASEGTAIACDSTLYNDTATADTVIDGNTTAGGYQTSSYVSGQWVGVEFDRERSVSKLTLFWESADYVDTYENGGYEIYFCQGEEWVALANASVTRESVSDMGSCTIVDTVVFNGVSSDAVKVEFLDGNITNHKYAPKLIELEIYPTAEGTEGYFSPTSITLAPVDGCEYSMDGTTWQTNNVFSGLTPNTSYTFYQRYAATANTLASASSEALTVVTPCVVTLVGDVNCDGFVSASDLTTLARHVGSVETVTGNQSLANAETDGVDGITAADLTTLARIVAQIHD